VIKEKSMGLIRCV